MVVWAAPEAGASQVLELCVHPNTYYLKTGLLFIFLFFFCMQEALSLNTAQDKPDIETHTCRLRRQA